MRPPRVKALLGEGKRSLAGHRPIRSLLRYADLGRRLIRRNTELPAAPGNSVGVRGLNSLHLDTIACLVEWLNRRGTRRNRAFLAPCYSMLERDSLAVGGARDRRADPIEST